MEIFKDIIGFTDYEVSNFGRVRTKTRLIRYTHSVTKKEHFRKSESRLLKVQFNNRTGYKFVQLYLNKKMFNKTIHRIVAQSFLESIENLTVVNHKDGNKHNNCVENLEWCTNEYNHKHATETGLKANGKKVKGSILNDNSAHAIKHLIKLGFTDIDLSKMFIISRPTINLIRNGKTWKHIALTGEELELKLN